MEKNTFTVDRLITTLAIQGFVLSLLCNLSVGLFMSGGLFLAIEDEPSTRGVFVAVMAMLSSAGVLMLAFFVLLGTLATTSRLRVIAQDEYTVKVDITENDNKNEESV